jgi:hypothetical protein
VLDKYIGALAAAPLAAQTRRTFTSKVRQYGVPVRTVSPAANGGSAVGVRQAA